MGCNNGFFGGCGDEWLWIIIIIAIIILICCCCGGNNRGCDDRCC